MLSTTESNKISVRNLKSPLIIKKSMYMSFVIIPVLVLLFFGIEDKNSDFFAKSKYPEDYRAVYDKKVYNIGIMVSNLAKILIISIVGILLSWIGHELIKLVSTSSTQSKITIDYQI